MTKTHRLLELMVKVYEKQRFTVDELAEEFGVSYRTMLRYLQELSGMGVPLYSEVGKHGGYSILRKHSKSVSKEPSDSLQKRIIKPKTHIIGIEFRVPFTAIHMANVIRPKVWSELLLRKQEISFPVAQEQVIGVVQYQNLTYHYIAGVEVYNPQHVPEGMISHTLPVKEYAVYTYQGSPLREGIDQAYFFSLDRMSKQGMDYDLNAYCLEMFKQGQNPTQTSEFDIYIPLQD